MHFHCCKSQKTFIIQSISEKFYCMALLKLSTIVWKIFVRDNLVVKFIRCVIFFVGKLYP